MIPSSAKTYFMFVSGLVLVGGWLVLDGSLRRNVLREVRPLERAVKSISSGLASGGVRRYEAFRVIGLTAMLLLSLAAAVGNPRKGFVLAVLSYGLYMLTPPVETQFGMPSLYHRGRILIARANQKTLRLELSSVTMQLKNLIMSSSGRGLTSHYVLERLLPYTRATKPYFAQLMSMNMKGESEEAARLFGESFGFKLAEDFVYVVLRLDAMSPEEFIPQVDALIEGFSEERRTMQARTSNLKENMVFVIASAEVLACIANFVVLIFVSTMSKIDFY